MKNTDKSALIKSPGLIGLGIFAGLSLYSAQYFTPKWSVGQGVTEQQNLTSFWNDRFQDMSVTHIENILLDRLEGKNKKLANSLAKHIQKTAREYHISPSLILAVIQAESTFRFEVKSPYGALGLMQVKPSTAKYIAEKWRLGVYQKAKDLKNPYINISVGVAYIAYLRDRFNNPMHYVAAYNLGPTTVGRMLDENNFSLGKVTKYVTEIHAEADTLRQNSAVLLAQN